MSYRLGVDVGGTFTDLLLIDEATSKTFRVKTPSTPSDQSVGVLSGIAKIWVRRASSPIASTSLMHGTTVATNAVLEGKGARVGLIVTEGYRQMLQIARSFVPGGLAGWIIWQKPDPLATLENTVEVKERIGARGDVVRQLDEASVRRALKELAAQGRRGDHRVADQCLSRTARTRGASARSPSDDTAGHARSRFVARSCRRCTNTSAR